MAQGIKEADVFTGMRDLGGTRSSAVGAQAKQGPQSITGILPVAARESSTPCCLKRCILLLQSGPYHNIAFFCYTAPPAIIELQHYRPRQVKTDDIAKFKTEPATARPATKCARGECVGGNADVRDRSDPEDQVKDGEAAHQLEPAQPLVAVGELAGEDEV